MTAPKDAAEGAREWPAWGVPDGALAAWVELQRLVALREPLGPPCSKQPEAWWGDRPAQLAYATAACQACLVLEECRAYAIAARERHGVWGGKTPAERRRTTSEEVA